MNDLVLLCRVAGRSAAISARDVQAVVELDGIVAVPRAPAHVLGLSALRSNTLTVIDVAAAMGVAPPTPLSPASRVAIVDHEGHRYALAVGAVEDVAETLSEPAPVPGEAGPGWQAASDGLIETAMGPALRLSVAAVINGASRSGHSHNGYKWPASVRQNRQGRPPMKHCLIIDDSRVIRKVSRHILESLGLAVDEAENGRDGLDKCEASMPDVILLDWNMPVMSGIEFIVQLRARPGGDRPKVVFCTTENDVAHIRQAISAGADEYVMKPFDHETLQIKLQLVGMA
jgi:two-component system chemotaxis response regulator CheY